MNKYVDHITINGETYYTGTVFLVKGMYLSYPHNYEATFVYYDPERNYVRYILHRFGDRVDVSYPKDTFERIVISVMDKKDATVKCPEKKRRPEMQIDGMFDGWVLYIVLMAVFSIFKDNIGIWCLLSYYFFSWRHKKIEKEGYYYEWQT